MNRYLLKYSIQLILGKILQGECREEARRNYEISELWISNWSVQHNHMESSFRTQITGPHPSKTGWPLSLWTGKKSGTNNSGVQLPHCFRHRVTILGTSANLRDKAKDLEGNRNGKKESAQYFLRSLLSFLCTFGLIFIKH